MAALVAAIHAFLTEGKAWMAGIKRKAGHDENSIEPNRKRSSATESGRFAAGGSRAVPQQRRSIRAVNGIAQRARPERIDARDGGLNGHKRIVGAEDDLRRR